MASLTLKNIPAELLDRLRSEARREHRSPSKHALVLLFSGLQAASDAPSAEALEQVARWRELAGKWISHQSVEEETRELYEARTRGRPVDL